MDVVYLKLLQYINHVVVVVAVIIIAVTLITLTFRQTPRTDEELRSEYHAGLVANDYRRASQALSEMMARSPEQPDLIFDKALLEHSLGDKQLAQTLLGQLTQSGHCRAAVWLLSDEFNGKDFSTLTQDQTKRFNELLVLSKKATLATDKATIHELSAQYCLANGQTEQAITHLLELVKDHPEAHGTLASAYERLNRPEQALEHLKKCRDYLFKELAKSPESKQLRQQLIETHLKLKEEKDAVNVAFKGFQLTRDPDFQQSASRILLNWASRLKLENANQSLEDRMVLIHNATQYAPQDAEVIRALRDLLVECHNTPDFEDRSSRVLAGGLAVESMHFILGLHCLMHDKISEGIQHLEQAELRQARVTPVLSAFLSSYSIEGASQRARALSIAERLHEHAPQDEYLEQTLQKLR